MAAVVLALWLMATSSVGAFTWIEGENIAREPEGGKEKWGYTTGSFGAPAMFSERACLHFQFDGQKAAEEFPADGVVFGYDFRTDEAGRQDVWLRIAYEWIRSPFDWRIDGGPWRHVSNDVPMIDLVEPSLYVSVGWLKVATLDLAAGAHTLEFRHLPRLERDGQGNEKPDRTLFLLDAVMFTTKEFSPNGPHKPGADYRQEIDRQAAENVFRLPAAGAPAERRSVELEGAWQYARWDDYDPQPETRLAGDTELPDMDRLFWYGIPVPAERNAARPDFTLAHRSIYRTRVDVPADHAGRGFVLEFEQFSMIASVFVNGVHCGASKNMYARWACDVSEAVRPGQVNEIAVVIKDPYYAIDPARSDNPLAEKYGLRYFYRVPPSRVTNESVCTLVDMPINIFSDTLASIGLWEPVRLTATGPAYTEDVFAKPSVREKKLGLELTLRNPGGQARTVSIENRVRRWSPDGPGDVAKSFAPREVALGAGAEVVVELAEAWADPRLWWPDAPNLYVVETVLSEGGREIDRTLTRFGFREWGWEGYLFTLNGYPWQVWADLYRTPDPADFPAAAHARGAPAFRFWNSQGWGGRTRREILDIMDEGGIVVRDSGVWDGQVTNYGMALCTPDRSTYNHAFLDNMIDQCRAWVRGNRNHPSIMIWSLENEVTYINANNRGMGEEFEPGVRLLAEEVMRLDPTRPVMVDGGNALRPPEKWEGCTDEVRALGHLPVNGGHYLEANPMGPGSFPDSLYRVKDYWGGDFLQRGAWPVLMDRPAFHGEYFFGNGWSTGRLAIFGGEDVYLDARRRKVTRTLMMRMMTEGLRWSNGTAAWHFWDSGTGADGQQTLAYSPVAVLCREWNWTFGAGRPVERTLKVFNQTSSDEPIRWAWSFSVDGRNVAGDEQTVNLPIAGRTEPLTVRFTVPEVSRRSSAAFTLEAWRGGERVFHEEKPAWVVVTDGPAPDAADGDIVVLDPHGEAVARLRARGVPFRQVASADELRGSGARLVLVGRDAVPEDRASDVLWQHLLLEGANLLVLEQQHPLHYRSVPADLELVAEDDWRIARDALPATAPQNPQLKGQIAFPQDLSHPVFAGLDRPDFFCWSGDHSSFKHAYRKAQRGARSLVHCHDDLAYTVLSECRLADSTMLLSQLLVGTKLGSDPVAQRLFDNMVDYALRYEPVRRTTSVLLPGGSPRADLLDRIQLEASDAADPLDALDKGEIAIVDATPANLQRLAGARDRVREFTAAGGWLMLWGLTPEGLDAFNTLAGTDHIIRPFTMERVELALPRHPLAAGLGPRDLSMEADRITRWTATMWMADDEFTHIVDLDDVAPFATIEGRPPQQEAARTSAPRNVVNGYVRELNWRYIYFVDISDGGPADVNFELARPETLTGLDIVPNAFYWQARKLRVVFDGAEDEALVFDIVPAPERQSFTFDEPVRASTVRLVLEDFVSNEGKPVCGFENVWLFARRPEGFRDRVQPLLNIGGLVAYPNGKGGILLNQLAVLDAEKNPVNALKKANIVKTLLGNMEATFGGGQVVVPGAANVAFQPVKIGEQTFNAYSLHDKSPSWFRDRQAPNATLAAMKTGRQELAGVPYELYDLVTSPTPSVLMIAGEGSEVKEQEVKGIAVGRRADALFFLHAYNAGRQAARWQQDMQRGRADDREPVVFMYRVNYEGGESVDVPVVLGRDVDHWLQRDPKDLKGAALATALPAQGNPDLKISLYSLQWTNPNPGKTVASVDLLPGTVRNPQQWGAPALVGMTTATQREQNDD